MDFGISPAPDSCESPALDVGEQVIGPPAGPASRSLLAFAALTLVLLGALALLIGVFQPFADQAGGCGGG